LVALLILGTLVYLLTGGTLFEAKSTVYLYLPDATGLLKGLSVQVNGIGVGKVASVEISGSRDPNRMIKVTMSIERDSLASISTDATAQVASETVVGDKYVAITAGVQPAHVQPNGEIPYKGSEELLKTEDLVQFQKRVAAIDGVFKDMESRKTPMGEFIQGDAVYRKLLSRVDEVERGVKAIANTGDAVGRELYTDRLAQQMHTFVTNIDDRLAQLQAGQGSGGRFLRSPAEYDDLRQRLAKLQTTLADLKKQPLLTSDQAYLDWTNGLAALIQRVQDFNATPMMITPATYESLNGAVAEIQQTAREFRENPKKFLRIAF